MRKKIHIEIIDGAVELKALFEFGFNVHCDEDRALSFQYVFTEYIWVAHTFDKNII